MALRVQKRWSQIQPQDEQNPHSGELPVRALNGILVLSDENISQIKPLPDPLLVLEPLDDDGFETRWHIVEIRAD